MRLLTGDADVGFAALGGPRRAPGHTLAPEVLGPEELLHLLPSDLYAGFPHHQAYGEEVNRGEEGRDGVNKSKWGRTFEFQVRSQNGGQVNTGAKVMFI